MFGRRNSRGRIGLETEVNGSLPISADRKSLPPSSSFSGEIACAYSILAAVNFDDVTSLNLGTSLTLLPLHLLTSCYKNIKYTLFPALLQLHRVYMVVSLPLLLLVQI